MPIREGDHLLLHADGVSETLADDEGLAQGRFRAMIDRVSEGGAPLLDAILADIQRELAGGHSPAISRC